METTNASVKGAAGAAWGAVFPDPVPDSVLEERVAWGAFGRHGTREVDDEEEEASNLVLRVACWPGLAGGPGLPGHQRDPAMVEVHA